MSTADRALESKTEPSPPLKPRSSRQRYLKFVEDYKHHRLDDKEDEGTEEKKTATDENGKPKASVLETLGLRGGKRREYLREYLHWLWSHRFAVAALFLFALAAAGLEMIEPLFMRFIIDRVLLNRELESATRSVRIHIAGALFLGVIVLAQIIGM